MNDYRIVLGQYKTDTEIKFDCPYDLAMELYQKLQHLPGIDRIEVRTVESNMIRKTWANEDGMIV